MFNVVDSIYLTCIDARDHMINYIWKLLLYTNTFYLYSLLQNIVHSITKDIFFFLTRLLFFLHSFSFPYQFTPLSFCLLPLLHLSTSGKLVLGTVFPFPNLPSSNALYLFSLPFSSTHVFICVRWEQYFRNDIHLPFLNFLSTDNKRDN